MPTQRARTHITHTPRVARALEIARARWPEEDRENVLILNLVEVGATAIRRETEQADEARIARIREIAGKHRGLYGTGYLEEIRDGWDA